MPIDPRIYVTNDKRLPVSLAGDGGKAMVVNQAEDGYEHSAQITITDITGQIIMWPTNTPPAGYLLCDGATYNYDDYPALGFILGASAGQTFEVPDIDFAKNSKGAGTLDKEAEGVGDHGHDSVDAGGHGHTISVNSVGNHGHGLSVNSVGDHTHGGDFANVQTGSGAGCANDAPGTDWYTRGAGGHSHSGSVNNGGAHGHSGSAVAVGDHNHSIEEHVGVTQPACTLINFLIKT